MSKAARSCGRCFLWSLRPKNDLLLGIGIIALASAQLPFSSAAESSRLAGFPEAAPNASPRLRRGRRLTSMLAVFERGEPVTNSEMFNPKLKGGNVPRISEKIFCKQPGDTPACEGAGCCCWSTFGLPHHPAYPNPDEGMVKRKCLNPPEGNVYVVVPGEVHDQGEDEAIKEDSSIPVYDGRNLCCAIPEKSPEYYSQRDVLEAVPTTVPPPTTTTTPPPPPTTTTTTTTNPYADFEALKMEEASTANMESAMELHDAAGMLNDTVIDLRDTVEAQGKDPRLTIHRANIERMKKAIHVYSSKEWASMQKYHDAANFAGEAAFAAHKAEQEKREAEEKAAAEALAANATMGEEDAGDKADDADDDADEEEDKEDAEEDADDAEEE